MDMSPEGVQAGLARIRKGPAEHDTHDEAHLAATEDGLDATYGIAKMHRWNPIVHLENLDLACYDRSYAPPRSGRPPRRSTSPSGPRRSKPRFGRSTASLRPSPRRSSAPPPGS